MRIQHNIMAMSAYRNFVGNNNSLAKNLEKLSSGYRINRAGDDAAGLAISEKMRAQITGLDAAQKNVKDGVSLVKTAEGAMQEVHDMLNRMKYLATQSANGTYDNTVDRKNLQKEVDALCEEIDRISKSANFNGQKLLNGELAQSVKDNAALDVTMGTGVNGKAPSGAGQAVYSFTMGTSTGTTYTTDREIKKTEYVAASSHSNVNPSLATRAQFEVNFGADLKKLSNVAIVDSSGGAIAELVGQDLANCYVANGASNGYIKLGDVFDITTNNGDSRIDAAETKITLTAKNAGVWDTAAGTDGKAILDALTGVYTAEDSGASNIAATGNLTAAGLAQGNPTNATSATFTFENLNIGGIQHGTRFEFNDITYEFTTDGSVSDASHKAIQMPLDMSTDAGKAALMTAIGTAIKNNDTDFASFTVDATTPAAPTLTLTATGTAHSSISEKVVFANTDTLATPFTVDKVDGDPANTAGVGQNATAVYNLDVKTMNKDDVLTIGGKTLTVVDNTTGTTNLTGSAMTITEADLAAADLDDLASKFSVTGATIDFNNNKVTITKQDVTTDLNTLVNGAGFDFKAKTAVPGQKAVADPDGAANNNLEITSGVTTYDDLAKMTVNGVKLSNIFEIKVGPTTVAEGNSTTVADGDSITFTAKNNGAVDADIHAILSAFDTDGNSNTQNVTVKTGYNQGTGVDTSKTQYNLEFDLDNYKGGSGFAINGKKYELIPAKATGTLDGATGIELFDCDLDTQTGRDAAMQKIANQLTTDFTDFDVSFDTNGKLTMTAKNATTDTNYFGVDIFGEDDTVKGSYSASNGTNNSLAGVHASNTYSFNSDQLKVGDTLSIGNGVDSDSDGVADGSVSITIVADGEGDVANGKFTLADVKNADALNAYFNNKMGNDSAAGIRVSFSNTTDANGNLTGTSVTVSKLFTDNTTAEDLDKLYGFKATGSRDTETLKGGLALQIGDTADEHNQLIVAIKDMSSASLGVGGLKIDSPKDAQDAIEKITKAINTVSATRGDLGAIQNRLEHTANNLSVMEENIQDAESTIRDTDMADEMTTYTKNNILIQAAQAMLAQANQQPQGVLQLLQ